MQTQETITQPTTSAIEGIQTSCAGGRHSMPAVPAS